MLLVGALALAGCATAPQNPRWTRDSWTGDFHFERDHTQCDYETEAASLAAGAGSSGYARGLREGAAKESLLTKCMATKGWRQVR